MQYKLKVHMREYAGSCLHGHKTSKHRDVSQTTKGETLKRKKSMRTELTAGLHPFTIYNFALSL